MKTLLVTGATGFIGRHLVATARRDGWRVRGLDESDADLRDPAAARQVVREIEPNALVHLAWTPDWQSPGHESWVAASVALVNELAEVTPGARAVCAGSCAEYDWSHGGHIAEDAPLRPATSYGRAKAMLHRAVARVEGVSLAWARIFFSFGPGERTSRLFPTVLAALFDDRPVALTPGDQVRDFLYVEDLAGALVALLNSDVRGAVNVGSGVGVAVRALVEELAGLAGRPHLLQFGELAPPDEPGELVAVVERLRDEVGWTPAVGHAEGLRRTVDAWRR